MENARKEMETTVAQQRLKLAMKPKSKPMDVFDVPIGSDVRVFREKKKYWEGPIKLMAFDEYKTASVKMENGITPFSISAVRPFLREENLDQNDIEVQKTETLPDIETRIEVYLPLHQKFYPVKLESYDETSKKHGVLYDDGDIEFLDLSMEKWRILPNEIDLCRNIRLISKAANVPKIYAVHAESDDPRFLKSSKAEIEGLLERGSYKVVSRS